MPFKVINNIAEIVQLALQGKTNKSHLTIDVTSKVKQRFVALVKDGGVDALRTAQSASDAKHSPAAADFSDIDDMDFSFNSPWTLPSQNSTTTRSTNAPTLPSPPPKRSISPTKMLHQLQSNMRLTTDALKAKYPLWFYDDQHSPDVPSALRISSDTRLICFPYHHASEHWLLGVLEAVSDGLFFSHYDFMSEPLRFKAFSGRVRADVDSCEYQDKELTSKNKASLGMNELNGFNQEEVSAVKTLDSILEEEARIDLEHHLSTITIDDLERHLVSAKEIHYQAQLEEPLDNETHQASRQDRSPT
ncbi:hypothetical protein ACHAP5_011387 [Fusarium lateritium]